MHKKQINKHDNGLIYKACRISPFKILCSALVPPHPGHGMPVIALNGQQKGIDILSDNNNPKNANPRIVTIIINNL